MGSVGKIIGGVTGGLTGGIAQAMTPQQQVADQSKLNIAIDQMRGMSDNAGNTGYALYNQAQDYMGFTQNDLGAANAAIDQAQGMTTGGNMGQSLDLLQGAASGNAPSAAQAQLQSAKDQAIAQQQAMANSGNASQMISGQKNAMANAAQLTQQAANQSAQLRANEMATARGQYAQGAAQQTAQAAQNAAQRAQIAAQRGQMAQAQLGASQNYQGLSANLMGQSTNAIGTGLGLQQGVMAANNANNVAVAGEMNKAIGSGVMNLLSDKNTKENIELVNNQRKQEYEGRARIGGMISRGFAGDTSSDKNLKKNIDKDTNKLHAFLDAIDPVVFEYKDADGTMGRTPGEHIGVIAQQIEKAPGGDVMIVETPEGKAIDMGSAVGTMLAAQADLHSRLKDLEEFFASKKKNRETK